MIVYSHDDWLLSRLFRRSGSVIPSASRWAFSGAVCAAGLSSFFESRGFFNDLSDRLSGIGVVWAGFTAIVGLLIAFRNNQAFARFWEGATLVNQMRGEWVSATSSLIALCSTDPEVEQRFQNFQ